MKKQEYLKKLKDGLKGFPEEVREDITADIREHFEMRQTEGISEEETAKRLGDPKKLAKQFEVSTRIDKAAHTNTGRDIAAAIVSTAGTGALALFAVVIPSVICYVLFIALLIASTCVAASGIAGIVIAIMSAQAVTASLIAAGILASVGLIGLGILMTIGSVALFKLFKKGTLHTLQIIKSRGR
jgi:uncharacterized membrane protein